MKQTVSELIDNELDERAARQVTDAIETDASLGQAWNEYHLIGDAMRGNRQVGVDVRAGVKRRLESEPTVLAPRRSMRAIQPRGARAALLAASVSFVAVLGWQQVAHTGHRAVLVAATASSQPAAAQQVPASTDAYFLAHQELVADQGLVRVTYQHGAAR